MGPFIRRLVVNFSPTGRVVRLNMDTSRRSLIRQILRQ